jgi:hypothetical protein
VETRGQWVAASVTEPTYQLHVSARTQVSRHLILHCRSIQESAPAHAGGIPTLRLQASLHNTDSFREPAHLTSVIEIPMETSISPGSAMLGSWPKLLRRQFIASKNLFRPSARSLSSRTQDPRCTSFMESRMASTGAPLLTSAGTRVENPKPTGYQPSRSFCVRAVWLSSGLRICGGICETLVVASATGEDDWR